MAHEKSPSFAAAAGALFVLSVLSLFGQSFAAEHGSLDTYSSEGISLAWAILKTGHNPELDIVVLRIHRQGGGGPVEIHGVDPFGGERKPLRAETPAGDGLELRLARSHFADYPRTEILFRDASRMIYFAGLPDTTPEFLDETAMAAYLEERLSRGKN